ncbi:unnamed protein product [Parnassius mnemosyne]|uniref:Odorant receptor n=1 Tax=Parnassius mnemosyne TaxID=213953 RepID=A0AAV1KAR3_9NEOP
MEKKLSYYSLEPHLRNVRYGGYFQIDPNSPSMSKWLHKVYMRIILFLTLGFTSQQILKVYEVRDDLDTVMATMFLLLTHFDSIYKEVVMMVKADQVQELLEIMKGQLFNQPEDEHKKLLLQTARKAKMLLYLFNCTALITCFLWVLYPLVLFLQGKHVEFAIWLPFDVNESPQFFIALLYVWIQTSWLAFNNTTMDVLIAFFLGQCTTQLNILRYDLENFVQMCKNKSKVSGESYKIVLHTKFKKILFHHNEIITFYEKVEDIYGGAIFCQFLFSGWILCTTAYRLVGIEMLSIEFLSMVLYLSCMLVELFLFCFYGSEVTHASEKLMESAYFMNWLETPIQHRKNLILFMERLKKPILPKAAIIVPLSNTTFISIVRSSYTFYAFLKNTQ